MSKKSINIKTVKQALIELAIQRHGQDDYDLWAQVGSRVLEKPIEEVTEFEKAQIMAAATQSEPVRRGLQNCTRKKELVTT